MSVIARVFLAVAGVMGGLALLALLQILVALLAWGGRVRRWNLSVDRAPFRDDREVGAERLRPRPAILPVVRGNAGADRLAGAAWGAAVYGLAGSFLLAGTTASWMRLGGVGFVVGALGVGLVRPASDASSGSSSSSVRAGLIAGVIGAVLLVLADAGDLARLLEPLGPAVWMWFLVTCVAGGAALGAVLAVCGVIAPLRLARGWVALRDSAGSRLQAASTLAACSLWLGAGFALLAMTVAAGVLWIHTELISQGDQATAAVAPGVSAIVPTPASDDPAAELPVTGGAASPSPGSEVALHPDESGAADWLPRLLGRPLSATTRNEHGWTDLHYAAVLDLPELARRLLDAGADVGARSPLQGMDPPVAAELPGRYPLDRRGSSFLDEIAPSDLTPLHLATSGDVVAVLLAGGADIHARDSFGNTPLHIVAYHNAGDAAVALLQHGADIHAGRGDDSGRPTTPLHNAAHLLSLEVVRVLLDHGADVNMASGFGTPLHEVAYQRGGEALPVVTALLERGADVDARGYDGRTPLHLAAFAEGASVPFVSTLLERGAAVDARDDDGNTPLHLATANSAAAIVAVLLVYGAEADARNNEGRTPAELSRDWDDATRALLRRYRPR